MHQTSKGILEGNAQNTHLAQTPIKRRPRWINLRAPFVRGLPLQWIIDKYMEWWHGLDQDAHADD